MRWTDDDVQAFARHALTCRECQSGSTPCPIGQQHVSKLAKQVAEDIDAKIAAEVYAQYAKP